MGDIVGILEIWLAFTGAAVTFIYPLFESMRAIEMPSPRLAQKWLTYWIIYTYIALFELLRWKILQRVVIWQIMKLVFCLWLILPFSDGVPYIYENFVRRSTKLRCYAGWNLPDDERRVLQMLSLDARKSVEKPLIGLWNRLIRVKHKDIEELIFFNIHRD